MKLKIIFTIVISLLLLGIVYADVTVIQFSTDIDTKEIINSFQEQPYIVYFMIGKLFFDSDIEKSIEMFDNSIELNSDFPPSFHNKGVAYYTQGEIELALLNFQKSIEIDPKYAKGHYSLGLLYFENGNYDSAIEHFKKAVKLDKDNANYNFDLGQSYVARFRQEDKKNDLTKALKYLEIAEEIDPDIPHLENNIEIIKSFT